MSARRAWLTPFWIGLALVAGLYLAFLVALIWSTATYTTAAQISESLRAPEIRYSIWLSLITCTASALLALLLAVPVGYLLSRGRFPAKAWLDAALDIPIVLPPMVVGLCLLIFFQTAAGKLIERAVPFTYTVAGVVLAQFVIGAAFAVR
ncbi:MAG: molybdenum ABC transporter permease, partial [Chthoniobacteraceae bacterium]